MKTMKCKFCDYICRPDNVRAHEKSVHEKGGPVCADCDKKFANKYSLKRHFSTCKKNTPNENNIEVPVDDDTEKNVRNTVIDTHPG